jgi:hypothetical protein
MSFFVTDKKSGVTFVLSPVRVIYLFTNLDMNDFQVYDEMFTY